jgi:Tfp pilus assembly protein PilP
MKRTLAISLFLALSVTAVAQTPSVTEQPATKPAFASTKPAAQKSTSGKPSPATAKTASAQKTAVTTKAAVVAAKPAAKPASVAAQTNAAPAAKVVAIPTAKTSASANNTTVALPATKTAPAPMAKTNANPVVKPIAGPKSTATPATAQAHPMPAFPVARPKAVAVKDSPAKAMPNANPFSAAKVKAQSVVAKPTPTTLAVKDNKPTQAKKPERKISAAGRRDPFVSPVVAMGAVGSGCSSGKRCLAIDQIALKGVVKSDNGMIAVVVNAMDKAYFLRENDPVFNGYVVKITGDSIVFKETFHDKLGKPLTRDVTKTISRPVA